MKKNKKIIYLTLAGLIIAPLLTSAQEAAVLSESPLSDTSMPVSQPVRPQPLPRPKPEIKNMIEGFKGEVNQIRQFGKNENETLRTERRDQINSMRPNASSTSPRSVAEFKALYDQNKTEINKIRADFQTTIKTNKSSTTQAIQEKREKLISGIQEKRELFKEELDERKELRSSTTPARGEKFKEGLLKIKDEKKKIKVKDFADNITILNTKITTRSLEHIDKIEEVLITIESRADKATANDVNVANVRSLILLSETAIAEARAAITLQTSKIYTVSIENEEGVKTSLQTTRDLLKKDVDTMNVKIKAAHEAVKKTANALKAIPKVNNEVIATTTTN
jgi:hypothetical protein